MGVTTLWWYAAPGSNGAQAFDKDETFFETSEDPAAKINSAIPHYSRQVNWEVPAAEANYDRRDHFQIRR